MGIGKQVADAYIEVHGDLSKFRKDLNKAGGVMTDWAESQADEFGKAWGDRTRANMDRQWNSVIDMMHSQKKVDFNRMIENFDPSDLEASFGRINNMLDELSKRKKISEEDARAIQFAIGRQVEAQRKQAELEGKLAGDREMWGKAHEKMMLQLTNARRNQADAEARFMKDALLRNEQWKKSFSGMTRAAKEFDLDRKFRDLTAAMASNDWSTVSRGATNMRELREQTMATATEMRNLGRMTDGQFAEVDQRLKKVSVNMGGFKVAFGKINVGAAIQRGHWAIIDKSIASAVGKFKGFTGLNVATDMFREGADFFQNMDRNAVKISKMALSVGTLGSAVVNMIGGVAVAGQDLAKIGQIGILAPAFLTGAAISGAVLISALKDMGTVLKDLKPRFEALQDTISNNFWEVAEQPIRNMVDTLLPGLSVKLGETATAWGGMFAQMADSIANLDQGSIGTMFDRMNEGIRNATGAVDPLIQAFMTMGVVGSGYFARFGQWITEISTQFNDFIQAAANDGRLNNWIEEAIQSIKDVWSILGSGISIFNSIASAAEAAGIGGLGSLRTALEQVAAVMESPGFQGVLTQLFEGAASAVDSVAGALIGLGPAIESFMPTLSGALASIGGTVATLIGYIGEIISNPAVQQGITDLVGGIKYAVEQLGPAIGPLGTSLGQVASMLAPVIAAVAEIVTAITVNLSPVLDQVTGAFSRITFAAGPEIVSVIETLSDALQGFVDAVLPPLEHIIMTVIPLLGPAFEAVMPEVEAVQGVMGILVERISELVDIIAPVLVPAIQQIADALAPVIEVIGIVADAVLGVLVPILGTLLIGVINNVVGVFQGFSTFIMSAVDMIVGVFNGFRDIFVGIFTGDFGRVLSGLSQVFSSIWNGITGMLSGALEFMWNAVQLIFVGKLVGGIKSALTSMGGFFTSTWNSIKSFLSGSMSSIVATIMNGLSRARGFVDDALGAMLRFFTNGWNSMATATTNGINTVMNWVGGIPGKIGGALSGLGTLLVGAGSAIMNGFLDGLKATWGAVTDFVGGVASWIAEHKGPISYDRVLLIPAGNAIMEGLGKGLSDKLPMLKTVLENVTDTMTDSVTDAFAKNKMYLAGADAALGLADGLKSKKSAVAGALNAVMPTASASVSASLIRTPGSPRRDAAETSAPQNAGTVIEAGAIVISTPTKNPEIVASKVIDEFANYSNL